MSKESKLQQSLSKIQALEGYKNLKSRLSRSMIDEKQVKDLLINLHHYSTDVGVQETLDIAGVSTNGSFVCISHYSKEFSDYKEIRAKQDQSWISKTIKEGEKLAKKGESEGAIACFESCLKTNPNCIEAYVARGKELVVLGEYAKALKDFKVALDLDSGCRGAKEGLCFCIEHIWAERGEFLLESNLSVEQAMAMADNFLESQSRKRNRRSRKQEA